MVKIAVTGAAGRMGRNIIAIINDTVGVELQAALERYDNPYLGRDAGEIAGIGKIGTKITSHNDRTIKRAGCIIDFSFPDATMQCLESASRFGIPMVIGTTGFSHQQRERLHEAARGIGIVLSPNMSIGVNLLLKVVGDIAGTLGDNYDIEIVEAHHRLKKDAPSGTAIRFAEEIARKLGRDIDKVAIYDRHGIIGERSTEEIGIQSIRAGDIVGDHTIIFAGPGERIEITHRAHSRDTFARGAVLAALWLVKQPEGIYDMQDVLGLKG